MEGENKVPMHVMFLLVSDVIGFFCRPGVDQVTAAGQMFTSDPTDFIFCFGLVANVSLMPLIAQERHLVAAYPHCLGRCGRVRRCPAVALTVETRL
ncbi:uncharacterized protein si:ch211-132e22.4 [Pseudoliparis swirei]|uniref:uncharacterized protein si:ch211-132e22.4 n=1 Tax=Pseudoliparis swirei TaxID=2059687 RepID=UPI0024BE7F60|nr:uncharacterized protein si:ch211-132e22.4 [Pseudoliparis swirei]